MSARPKEVFRLLAAVWNIDRAKEIVSDGREPNCHVPVASFAAMSGLIGIDDEHAPLSAHYDLSVPLIGIVIPAQRRHDKDALMIIDGWHRIQKADMLRDCLCGHACVETLPCHVLTDKEARAVQMRGPVLRRRRFNR